MVRRQARRGSPQLGVAAADVAGDLLGLVALAAGSLRHRSAVL
jgi:hypothetical protein